MLKFTLKLNKNDNEEVEFKINPSYKELEEELVNTISDDDNITHITIFDDENTFDYYIDSNIDCTLDELIESFSEMEFLNIDFMDYLEIQVQSYMNNETFLLYDEIVYYSNLDDYINLAIENSSLFEIYNTQPKFKLTDYKKFYDIDAIKDALKYADNVHITKANGILLFE